MGRVVARRKGWEEELADKIRNNADTLERFRSLDHSRMIYSDIGCDMLRERNLGIVYAAFLVFS